MDRHEWSRLFDRCQALEESGQIDEEAASKLVDMCLNEDESILAAHRKHAVNDASFLEDVNLFVALDTASGMPASPGGARQTDVGQPRDQTASATDGRSKPPMSASAKKGDAERKPSLEVSNTTCHKEMLSEAAREGALSPTLQNRAETAIFGFGDHVKAFVWDLAGQSGTPGKPAAATRDRTC